MAQGAEQAVRKFWTSSNRVTRFTIYTGAAYLVLLTIARIVQGLRESSAPALASWTRIVGIVFMLLLVHLWLRWMRQVFMWRLRNRLIVTYVFIGVIPVALLIGMWLIAAYGFAGQFATFVITSDLVSEQKALQSANGTVLSGILAELEQGESPQKALESLALPPGFPGTRMYVQIESRGRVFSRAIPDGPTLLVPQWISRVAQEQGFEGLVEEDGRVYIRAVKQQKSGAHNVIAVSSIPVERSFMQRVAAEVGEVNLYPPDLRTDEQRKEAVSQAGSTGQSERQREGVVVIQNGQGWLPAIRAGQLPPKQSWWDRNLPFGSEVGVVSWDSERTAPALITIQTRLSLLQARLARRIGQLATGVTLALAVIAFFFMIVELMSLIVGVRLTRTITRSVHELYEATQHVNRGDLKYRIQVHSRDQLAALETSFNSMTESLAKLIAEQKEKQRIESELAIAQEVQAQLFPRNTLPLRSLEVYGLCRPARTVSGDYYDFLPLGHDMAGIAVGDVAGKGISAALLMATIHSAVRVYEFGRSPSREQLVAAGAAAISSTAGGTSIPAVSAELSPAAALSLLNRHLFHSTPPEKYATLFLGVWDGEKRKLTYSNGGHLPPIILRADGTVQRLEDGGTVIGLFDNVDYEESSTEMNRGDLFVAYSDGLTEPENEFGEFGEDRLIDLLMAHREMPLHRVAEVVTGAVSDWIGANEQPDDVTLVLARAK